MAARIEGDQRHKRALARAAAATIRPGGVPVPRQRQHQPCPGPRFLPEDNDLAIATNSIDIAGAVLRRRDLKLIVLGGEADPIIGGCVVCGGAAGAGTAECGSTARIRLPAPARCRRRAWERLQLPTRPSSAPSCRAERTAVVLIAGDKLGRTAPHPVANA